ncbi:MAG: glycosyltransferase, partial [Chloroflexota bacterium]
MTAFNRERYIADAIESVLAQTFTDFELIVVDDASEDRTVDIARKYE